MKSVNETVFDPRNIKITSRNSSVLKKVRIPSNSFQTEEEKRRIINLQQQILSKEQELNSVRETLARNDTIDIKEAQLELNHLQSAVDIVKHKCNKKLQPVLLRFQKAQAGFEGLKKAVLSFDDSAKERDIGVQKMQKRIEELTAALESCEFEVYDEHDITPTVREISKTQTELDKNALSSQMGSFQERMLNHLSTTLISKLDEAKEKEEKARKKFQNVASDYDEVIVKPRQIIDEEWIMAKHKHQKLKIIMEDARRSMNYLKETAEKINAGSKLTLEELNKCKLELKDIGKYLPDAQHIDGPKKGDGVSRSDLTILEAKKDMNEVLLNVVRTKTKVTKSMHEKLKLKVDELTCALEETSNEFEQTKIERVNAEESLLKANEQRSDLLSRLTFVKEEKKLLIERLEQQKKLLKEIESQTEAINERISQQNINVCQN